MSERVPEGWYETELHQFVDVSRGYAFKSSDYRASGNPIVRVTNINNSNGLDLTDNVVFLDESRTKEFESYLLKNDDFLLVMVGATVGKYAEINTKGRLLFLNQNMWRLSVHDDRTNSQRFAIYGLQKVVEEFLGTMQGSAREFLTQKDFGKAPVLLPPLSEQKKIASILTSVDELIEKTQLQINKLQDLKKATMNELLTIGIGHTEFKDSELGRIPKSWEVTDLRMIGTFAKGKGISKNDIISRGIPCIRYAEIYTEHNFVIKSFKSFISPETVNTTKKLKTNDIIFAGSGETVEDIGKSVAFIFDYDAYVGGDSIIFSPNVHSNSIFLSYQLNDDLRRIQLRKLGQGSSVIHVYATGIMQLKIALPPLSEQNKIVDILLSYTESINKLKQKLSQTQSLKKSLMQDLLTGKVRVTAN
ncbi:restriction endonuclease subunit S [Gammaproteobacteria bacterium]|nr:restriction endonuclease subunit S [Gammaproteobacteria bacterium]